jgi:dCTP deaminase
MSTGKASWKKRPGVLNKKQMLALIKDGIIEGWNSSDADVGDSSLDLHIGDRCWELPAGFKCRSGQHIDDIILSAVHDLKGVTQTNDLRSGLSLEIGHTYLFEIQEYCNLSDNLYGQGSGKSSIGRLDVLTRLLCDQEYKYDYVSSGPRKKLYVEVTPLSFPIFIKYGDPIYQLRFTWGAFNLIQIRKELLELYSVMMKDEDGKKSLTGDDQINLRLNLNPVKVPGLKNPVVAFKAKKNNSFKALNVNAKSESYEPREYWEPIGQDKLVTLKGQSALQVERDAFYILRSKERFNLPYDIAVYALAMTEEVGELRIHHAGFVHPGFGSIRRDGKGTPLIFEVRGHDVNMYLVHGDLMATLKYYPMSEKSHRAQKPQEKVIQNRYEEQGLKLSTIFKDFNDAS